MRVLSFNEGAEAKMTQGWQPVLKVIKKVAVVMKTLFKIKYS
jgi:hypothetical protein